MLPPHADDARDLCRCKGGHPGYGAVQHAHCLRHGCQQLGIVFVRYCGPFIILSFHDMASRGEPAMPSHHWDIENVLIYKKCNAFITWYLSSARGALIGEGEGLLTSKHSQLQRLKQRASALIITKVVHLPYMKERVCAVAR
jgi:hypothetical protein